MAAPSVMYAIMWFTFGACFGMLVAAVGQHYGRKR